MVIAELIKSCRVLLHQKGAAAKECTIWAEGPNPWTGQNKLQKRINVCTSRLNGMGFGCLSEEREQESDKRQIFG